jgi:ABC-type polysaccharide/polyol phosphate transport system ATPase subunit
MSAIAPPGRAEEPTEPAVAVEPAISIHNVSKTFELPHEQYHTLKERALHPFRKRTFDLLRAVQNVTVDIAPGDFFGIVGRNGSGKSTLLKCIAGIYGIDEGQMRVRGRLSPFIELGVGFNADLTARDNVIINAIMLGLSRKEAIARFDDIIAFAELEEFVDLRLKNYSSGMYVRLAFATAVQVDADILLIDEVLAVGDANFQQKCFDQFTRLQEEGRTIVLVTHDMAAVERFCSKAMLIERGAVIDISDATSIARQYNAQNFRAVRAEHGGDQADLPDEHPDVQVISARFETEDGEPALTCVQGETCTIAMQVHFNVAQEEPILAVALLNESGQVAFSANTDAQHIDTGRFEIGADATVKMRFDNYLSPGRYRLIASVARAGLGADLFDANHSTSIIVLPDKPGGGFADLPVTIEIDRR